MESHSSISMQEWYRLRRPIVVVVSLSDKITYCPNYRPYFKIFLFQIMFTDIRLKLA